MTLSAAYTFTDAEDTSDIAGQSGNQLPGRPRHVFNGQIVGTYAGLEATYNLDLDSGNVLDRANYRVVPDRVFNGFRLSYNPSWLEAWTFTIEANNLLDHHVEMVPVLPQPPGIEVTTPQPMADFIGSPLPGRTLFATVQWEVQ